jgi:DNA-binding MurR/RpiR family transcriptional regulator
MPQFAVMDNKELARAEQLVADDQRADCIIAGSSTGVADDVCISFRETREFGGIEPGIHTRKNSKAARGWQCQIGFVAERRAVLLISA